MLDGPPLSRSEQSGAARGNEAAWALRLSVSAQPIVAAARILLMFDAPAEEVGMDPLVLLASRNVQSIFVERQMNFAFPREDFCQRLRNIA